MLGCADSIMVWRRGRAVSNPDMVSEYARTGFDTVAGHAQPQPTDLAGKSTYDYPASWRENAGPHAG